MGHIYTIISLITQRNILIISRLKAPKKPPYLHQLLPLMDDKNTNLTKLEPFSVVLLNRLLCFHDWFEVGGA